MNAMHYAPSALAVIIGVFPALFTWRKERRLRRLSEALLGVSESVTEMEKLMLKGTLSVGDASHDILFSVMQRIQFAPRYAVRWNVFQKPSEEQIKFENKLRGEIKKPECAFRSSMDKFADSYSRAFRLRHPWMSKAYFLHLCMTFLTLAGLLGLFSALLKLELLRKRVSEIRKKFQQQYIAESGALLLVKERMSIPTS